MDSRAIEQVSRTLIERMWRNRTALFPQGLPERILLLDPRAACSELGFEYDPHPTLPWYSPAGLNEVAGVLDREGKRISVAQKYGRVVERFTAAHEIGHLLMHPDHVMHREVPGWNASHGTKPLTEREADYFAACFLVPINILREEFEKRFGPAETFTFDEHSGFWLTPGDPERLMSQGTDQQRALALATATRFDGRGFASLCDRFQVSKHAMTIRMFETGLVPVFP